MPIAAASESSVADASRERAAAVSADDCASARLPSIEVNESADLPVYESVRAIDTLGLRVLNSYRLDSRETRTGIAKSIYAELKDFRLNKLSGAPGAGKHSG